jgi:hypothetical protein
VPQVPGQPGWHRQHQSSKRLINRRSRRLKQQLGLRDVKINLRGRYRY